MKKGRSSGTAELVAGWRWLAHLGHTSVPGFADPHAHALMRGRWEKATVRMRDKLDQASPAERARIYDRYDHVILRTASLDALLGDTLTAGVRQVVLLGAGLDTRAWRLPGLAGARFFEVDHPDTQRVKRERTATLPAPHTPPVFVPVDFAGDTLGDSLAAAGHDADAPTAWLWEGVVMYLRDPAVTATLSAIRARSAPGSTLLLQYHTPDPLSWWGLVRRIFLWSIGEPQVGLRDPAAMAALVRTAGFRVDADLGVDEQAARVGGTPSAQPSRRASRILVARP